MMRFIHKVYILTKSNIAKQKLFIKKTQTYLSILSRNYEIYKVFNRSKMIKWKSQFINQNV